ncbi:hypothetical protein ACFUJR_32605 [Streptomyces sp. NPDC057271]|uniref:hypothetical protein n=1 Tax=unclassified Streptomyces TaxID=2593676 RepID=UPI00362B1ABF
MAIKRCKASFAVSVNGVPRMVTVGQLLDASDPVIKGREALFEDAETYVSGRAPKVEQATSEPGERRSVLPPRRQATKKAAATPQAGEKGNQSGQEGMS